MAALANAKILGGTHVLKMIGRNETRINTVASTAENHPVPAGAKYVRLSASALSYIKGDGTATVPAADETTGAASIKIDPNVPYCFDVTGVTNISCISATAGSVIALSFFGAFE